MLSSPSFKFPVLEFGAAVQSTKKHDSLINSPPPKKGDFICIAADKELKAIMVVLHFPD